MSLSDFGTVGGMMAGTLQTALLRFRRNSGVPLSSETPDPLAESPPRVSNFPAADETADARIAHIIRSIPQRRTRR